MLFWAVLHEKYLQKDCIFRITIQIDGTILIWINYSWKQWRRFDNGVFQALIILKYPKDPMETAWRHTAVRSNPQNPGTERWGGKLRVCICVCVRAWRWMSAHRAGKPDDLNVQMSKLTDRSMSSVVGRRLYGGFRLHAHTHPPTRTHTHTRMHTSKHVRTHAHTLVQKRQATNILQAIEDEGSRDGRDGNASPSLISLCHVTLLS